MKCSYHNEIEAIGVCRECLRGLCKECAAEFPFGLACKGKHEKEAEKIHNYLDGSIKRQAAIFKEIDGYRSQVVFTTFFYITIGAALGVLGFKNPEDALSLLSKTGFFIMAAGLVYLLFGMANKSRK